MISCNFSIPLGFFSPIGTYPAGFCVAAFGPLSRVTSLLRFQHTPGTSGDRADLESFCTSVKTVYPVVAWYRRHVAYFG